MKKFLAYLKNSIYNIIKGIVIGVANIIPGVSGGTMAVSLGIYDRLIASINGIFKEFKRSIAFIVPVFVGAGLGIVGFSYLIEYLLEKQTLPTALAFIGMILGGLPVMISSLRKKQKEIGMERFKIRLQDAVAFLILFAVAAGLPLLKESTDTLQTLDVTFGNAVMLFFGGIIAAATMIIPGVSGSMVMMILGFYYGVINLVTSFFDALLSLDFEAVFRCCLLIFPFGIGVLLGIFFIAKLINFLFEHHGVVTYSAILGLIAASPFAIIYNTGAFSSAGSGAGFILSVTVGVIVMLVLGYGTYVLGKHE